MRVRLGTSASTGDKRNARSPDGEQSNDMRHADNSISRAKLMTLSSRHVSAPPSTVATSSTASRTDDERGVRTRARDHVTMFALGYVASRHRLEMH